MMKKSAMAVVLLFAVTMMAGCGAKTVSKLECFPGMYEEQPASVLILPPMNESTAADAKEYYITTVQEPLALYGYYTLPVPVTNEILKMEGVYDAELLYGLPLNKFKEYFGADAVMFTTIKNWDLSYMVLAGSLTVSFDSELRSTETNRTLWKYNGTVEVDLSGSGGSMSLIVQAVTTAVNCAMADYVPYARLANFQSFSSMPMGKYHPMHMKDQSVQIVDQRTSKPEK